MSEATAPMSINARKRRLGPVGLFVLLLGLVLALIAAAVVIWWGPIRETAMDPGIPFETYRPPPAPDYAERDNWALLPGAQAMGPADVFFIHPNTYDGRTWNADPRAPRARRLLNEVMLPNYAGPFQRLGRVFAPLYRQASLYTTLTLREDAQEARAFAYSDIRAAFDRYRASHDSGRPLIIVGAGQGAILAERLARETAADPSLRARLAAVYLIEAAVPADAYGQGASLPACAARMQAGCVAAYLTETHDSQRRTRERLRHAPVWDGEVMVSLKGRKPLCFNPLLGAVTDTPAGVETNMGGANASGLEWGERPGFLQHQVSAQCVDGILKVGKPRSPALRPRLSWTERQRERPYNLFYADLEADAQARVAALAKQ